MFKKNTAVTGFGIGHFINATTGAAVTTGTPTCTRLLDGTGGSCENAAAYDGTAGVWKINLAAADLNADTVVLSFALTGCLPIAYTIRTVTKLVSDLNDIAATAIVSNGAITTASGKVSGVGTVDTLTGYTAPLDSTATQAAAAAALTAYDPPTNTEMEARTILAADYATSDQAAASLLVLQAVVELAGADAVLAATQPNYAPAKAGDAMALTTNERNAVINGTITAGSVFDATEEGAVTFYGADGSELVTRTITRSSSALPITKAEAE